MSYVCQAIQSSLPYRSTLPKSDFLSADHHARSSFSAMAAGSWPCSSRCSRSRAAQKSTPVRGSSGESRTTPKTKGDAPWSPSPSRQTEVTPSCASIGGPKSTPLGPPLQILRVPSSGGAGHELVMFGCRVSCTILRNDNETTAKRANSVGTCREGGSVPGMTPHPTPWTMETVTAGPARFYHEIAGVGLVFPRESSLGWTPHPPQKAGPPCTPPPLVARKVPPLGPPFRF
jgi:hypothetical protein